MTNPETTDTHDGAPDGHSIQDEQRVDEASGQKAGPPGRGDLDPAKLDQGTEELEKAGAGH